MVYFGIHCDMPRFLPRLPQSEEQRCRRYSAVARRIMAELPDAVLLQEVDEWFIPMDWSGGLLPCGGRIDGYTAHRSFSPTTGGVREGVAILLRNGVFERAQVPLPCTQVVPC